MTKKVASESGTGAPRRYDTNSHQDGGFQWVDHTYRYRLFPNEEHKTLLENKAREITQTSPPTYPSQKLY